MPTDWRGRAPDPRREVWWPGSPPLRWPTESRETFPDPPGLPLCSLRVSEALADAAAARRVAASARTSATKSAQARAGSDQDAPSGKATPDAHCGQGRASTFTSKVVTREVADDGRPTVLNEPRLLKEAWLAYEVRPASLEVTSLCPTSRRAAADGALADSPVPPGAPLIDPTCCEI